MSQGKDYGRGHENGHDLPERLEQTLFHLYVMTARQPPDDGMDESVGAELGTGGEADYDKRDKAQNVQSAVTLMTASLSRAPTPPFGTCLLALPATCESR